MEKEYFTIFDKLCIAIGIVEYLFFVYYVYNNKIISLVIYILSYEKKIRWKIIITSIIAIVISWHIYILTNDILMAEMVEDYPLLGFWPLGFKIYGSLTLWNYIPLLIGLYYFYYRFQRNVSESHIINFYLMPMKLIFTEMIIFLSIMVGKIENNLSLCDVILLLIAASWMIGFVGYVFHRLKINFFLEISMDYFNAEIEILKKLYYYEWGNYLFKRHIYMDINNRIEIIYQILEYIINKNTNIIYNKYSSEIMKNFMCLKDFIGLEYAGKK